MRIRTILAAITLLAVVGCGVEGPPSGGESRTGGGEAPFDLLLTGGRVLDGAGNPWIHADVGIRDGRIAAVGFLSGAQAREVVDVSGLYVAPGFIDGHTHAGDGLDSEDRSHAEPLLAQGLTTILVNPDGGGMADMAEQRTALLEHGLGVNVGQLVPHGSVRRAVMGMDDRAPTAEELQAMKDLVRRGMELGAFGLSSGTFYAPGNFATNDEIIELAKVVAEFGGAYQSHPRDESSYSVGVIESSREIVDVGRQAGIPTVVTHVKALGPDVWGKSAEMVEMYRAAREEGVQVFTDQYPYDASSTGLIAALLPRWVEAGGRDSLVARLNNPELLPGIREGMVENLARRGGAERIQFRRFEPDPAIEGRLLSDVARDAGMDPIDYSIELFKQGSPGIVSFNMSEEDIRRLMVQSWNMTASDGSLPRWQVGVPHPRAYGAFPRKIRKYVVEDGVVELEDAIRSMTSLPALVYDIPLRGLLAPGMIADLAVFDLAALTDRATFTEPHQLSEGMVHVLIGGEFAVREGGFTGARLGSVLARQ
jgi:N-acyl-D-aspartate/D-glutamate deacylase